MYLISKYKDILYMYIYNKTSETYYNLMLKNVSSLVILLSIKVGYFIILWLTKYKYLREQILMRNIFHVFQAQKRMIYLYLLYYYWLLISQYLSLDLLVQYYFPQNCYLFQIKEVIENNQRLLLRKNHLQWYWF